MAQKVLSFPFEINPRQLGVFQTVEQGTDAYKAQQIAAFLQTQKGERPIFRDFGIEDPSFRGPYIREIFEELDIVAEFPSFYPEIQITDIEVTENDDGTNDVVVLFS